MEPQIKICKSGVFLQTTNELITGWEKAKRPEDLAAFAGDLFSLEAPKVGFHWVGAKIPMSVMRPVIGTIMKFPNMETGYMLYYNRKDRKWLIRCPQQFGFMTSVFFENDGYPINGYYPVGTIHTHPNMGAFWSPADLSSNSQPYTLHMVFGLNEGRVHEIKISVFTITGHFDIPHEEIFEDDVDWSVDCEPDKLWQECILAQFEPDFKLTVDGKTYGPHIRKQVEPAMLYSQKELQFMHDSLKEASKEMKPSKKKKIKPKSTFQKLLVEKYGYDAGDLADFLEFPDGEYDDLLEEEALIYDQGREDGLCDGVMASKRARDFLDDSCTYFTSDYVPGLTPDERSLACTLYNMFYNKNWVSRVHAAEDIKVYEKELNIIFKYLSIETIMILLEDLRDQIDLAAAYRDGMPFGGRLLSEITFVWAKKAIESNKDLSSFARLDHALEHCADPSGCLSWHAMAMLLVSLESTPITIIHLWEIWNRMQDEGLLKC